MAEQTTTTKQRERQGVVVSDKMDKTIVVQVSAVKPHAEYKKVVRTHQPVEGARRDTTKLASATPCSCANAGRCRGTRRGA